MTTVPIRYAVHQDLEVGVPTSISSLEGRRFLSALELSSKTIQGDPVSRQAICLMRAAEIVSRLGSDTSISVLLRVDPQGTSWPVALKMGARNILRRSNNVIDALTVKSEWSSEVEKALWCEIEYIDQYSSDLIKLSYSYGGTFIARITNEGQYKAGMGTSIKMAEYISLNYYAFFMYTPIPFDDSCASVYLVGKKDFVNRLDYGDD